MSMGVAAVATNARALLSPAQAAMAGSGSERPCIPKGQAIAAATEYVRLVGGVVVPGTSARTLAIAVWATE